MGFDYALVHLKFTIPPAVLLTFIYRPLCTHLDVYKLVFLIAIAVVATTPWDSYLIRRKVWTYPPSVIIGPTLFSIPAEEVFFFIIQTYNTALLFLLLSKPTFKPTYLVGSKTIDRHGWKTLTRLRRLRTAGQVGLAAVILCGAKLVWTGAEGTYLGLIFIWAGPFALLLWTLAYQFLIGLPLTSTVVPIALPTIYLWIVDTIALRRGTWTIESGTKLGIHVWAGLEFEEAVFFLTTNTLIVFGLIAFENAVTILETFPDLFPTVPLLPSPVLLLRALLTDHKEYDEERLVGIQEAVDRLRRKSRSFYLASSVFSGRLRIDLILLYSFCRVVDDLIDDAKHESEARAWIVQLTAFLNQAYATSTPMKDEESHAQVDVSNFPKSAQNALLLLPTPLLSPQPLYDLLEGFKTDLMFSAGRKRTAHTFPIFDESDLDKYGAQVASTVAQLCLELVFHHSPTKLFITNDSRKHLIQSGSRMGLALQCVNIARDISTDADIGRVYIPTTWLREEGMTPQDVIDESSTEWESYPDTNTTDPLGLDEKRYYAIDIVVPNRPEPLKLIYNSTQTPYDAAMRFVRRNSLPGDFSANVAKYIAFAAQNGTIDECGSAKIDKMRARLLSKAFTIYDESIASMAELPIEARAPMIVAVESYMEIGRVLREKKYEVMKGRPTVPKYRRIMVAWKALNN